MYRNATTYVVLSNGKKACMESFGKEQFIDWIKGKQWVGLEFCGGPNEPRKVIINTNQIAYVYDVKW